MINVRTSVRWKCYYFLSKAREKNVRQCSLIFPLIDEVTLTFPKSKALIININQTFLLLSIEAKVLSLHLTYMHKHDRDFTPVCHFQFFFCSVHETIIALLSKQETQKQAIIYFVESTKSNTKANSRQSSTDSNHRFTKGTTGN